MKQMIAGALVAATIVFASVGSSQARSNGHRPAGGFAGGRPAAHAGVHRGVARPPVFHAQPRFQGHHREQPRFQGHHRVRHGGRGRVFIGVAPAIVAPAFAYGIYGYGGAYDPGYAAAPPVDPAPPTYYYCPSAGAYYPDVPSCPEPWVPVQ